MDHPVLESSRRTLREWHRDVPERKIAGVCASVAAHLDLPLPVVRVAFVLAAVVPPLSSIGITLYLALWFLLPPSATEPSAFDRAIDAVAALAGRGEDERVRRELDDDDLR